MVDIIQIIADPPTAQKSLKPQLRAIESGAAACLDAVMAIDKKFEELLLYACELHAACVDKDQTAEEDIISYGISVASEQCRLEDQKATVAQAQKVSDLLEKQVSMAGETFKQASDKFPTG
jgi:hypothetical protein